jgi:hypothetical protein
MATLAAPGGLSAQQRERTFYFHMSLAFLAAAVAGFGFFFAIGASTFASPWWVHVHAVTMTAFLSLYVLQNWLVHRGELAMHRRLGAIGAVLGVWLAVYSTWVITLTLGTGRFPPFFTPNWFLMMDWLNLAVFAGLAGAGIALRNRTDWHKRLMFGGMLSLMSVAWGRLIIPQFFDQRAISLVTVVLLAHLGMAMWFDRRVHGRVHPAHYYTGAALVGWIAVLFALSGVPQWVAFADSFAA